MLSLASGAVLAGIGGTLAAGETFVWDGKGNGTGFSQESNWTDITVRGPVLMFDENGYEVHEWLPVFDGDGNPVYAWHQLFDENDEPVLDDEGKEIWFQGEQELEAGPLVYEEGDVLLQGPPDGGQNMLLLSGTPNISSSGRHINDADLLGGEFLIRTGTVAVIPGDFFVDGILTIDDTGILTVKGDDSRGQNVMTAGQAVIDGGTARGTGILRVTGVNSQTRVYDPTMGLTQTGGLVTELTVETTNYTMSGGTLSALVNFGSLFELSGTGDVSVAAVLTGAPGATMTQSGGTMAGTLGPISAYTQSGGLMSGTITVGDYNLAGASALSTSGKITATNAFNLGPEGGTATMEAWLRGTGDLVKTGDSRVILTNGANDFTGTVAVNAGILEVIDGALPDAAVVTIEKDAALQLTTNTDTSFTGPMTGKEGDLIKAGSATATLSGAIDLGDLWINAGRLNIGTGTSTNEAVFDSAVVAADATLYIAKGATLTIRVPKHLINNGTLINDGTVHDDLENYGNFANNEIYNANVASNSGTINNNKPGYWTGTVESNSGRINNAVDATWNGAVEGNTGIIYNDGIWLNGTVTNGTIGVNPGLQRSIYNNYTGVWNGDIAENYSWIFNEGGTWNGDILSNHRQVWNDNRYGEIGIGYWVGDVVSNDGIVFNGGGGDWTGNVLSNGSAGYIKNDAPAVWHGSVYANEGTMWNRGIWGGDVVGNSRDVYNSKTWNGAVVAAGTLTSAETDNAPNIGNTGMITNATADAVWTGDVGGNIGTISNVGGLWDGNVVANGGMIDNEAGIFNQLATGDSAWIGDVISNSGIIKNATGSEWTGTVLANAGTITTTGLWTGDITSGGRLEAGGSITGAVVNSGTLALVGDLGVGSVSFGDGAYFDVDLNAAGEGEVLTANGLATLDGIVRIKAGSGMTSGDYLTPYVILTAASRSGTFDGVTTDLAFLTPTLDYTATTASVTLQRNTQEFTAVGVTSNQQTVAAEVEGLGAGNALYDAVLWLTPEQAQAAFDQLSGEVYATTEATAADTATVIGDIALGRVEKALGGIDARGSASGYAATSVDSEGSLGAGVWTQLYGARGRADGSDETSSTDNWIGGVALGLDGLVGDWRVGVMLDAGTGATDVAELGSTVGTTRYGIGVYGGTNWGDTQLAFAGLYTRQDNASTRNVAFGGFEEELSAEYGSTTTQAGAKLSHEFDFGAMSVSPYASAAYISHATDGFSETGGDAALSAEARTAATTVATIGATVGYQMVIADGTLVTATASLGWRHSFADTADASLSLAGGDPFVVAGTASQRDAAAIAAGINLDISDETALDFAYDAQVSDGSQIHALSGTWTTKF